jgi:ribonuclease HI
VTEDNPEYNKDVKKSSERKVIAEISDNLFPGTQIAISLLNKSQKMPDIRKLMPLKTGKKDSFSSLRINNLKKLAGQEATELVEKELPNDTRHQAVALRWMLRGLAMDLAIEKAKTDAIISYNKGKQ